MWLLWRKSAVERAKPPVLPAHGHSPYETGYGKVFLCAGHNEKLSVPCFALLIAFVDIIPHTPHKKELSLTDQKKWQQDQKIWQAYRVGILYNDHAN